MLDSSSLSFPANPVLGQTHDFEGRTYEWNGVGWRQISLTPVDTQLVYKYTAPGTWEKRTGLKMIRVKVQGGGGTGGAGGPSAPTGGGGGGGAAGGYAEGIIPAPTIPGPVAVTAASGTATFGPFLTAAVGSTGASGSTPANALPAGGTASGPAAAMLSAGKNGPSSNPGVSPKPGNPGADSWIGTGGAGGPAVGSNAPGFGAGGGGGGPVTQAGGTGGAAIVIVEEFY